MEPITTTILILIGTTIPVMLYWAYIVDFLAATIIPWVRENVSVGVGELLSEVLVFADKGIAPARRKVKDVWKYFKHSFLGSETIYTKTSATHAIGKTVTTVRDENGKVMQSTITEELNWEDLPESIRSEMTRQNTASARMDLKKCVEEKFQEQAQEKEEVLEETH